MIEVVKGGAHNSYSMASGGLEARKAIVEKYILFILTLKDFQPQTTP